jgi:hypothetical protein
MCGYTIVLEVQPQWSVVPAKYKFITIIHINVPPLLLYIAMCTCIQHGWYTAMYYTTWMAGISFTRLRHGMGTQARASRAKRSMRRVERYSFRKECTGGE